jgi:hypothetical protein
MQFTLKNIDLKLSFVNLIDIKLLVFKLVDVEFIDLLSIFRQLGVDARKTHEFGQHGVIFLYANVHGGLAAGKTGSATTGANECDGT